MEKKNCAIEFSVADFPGYAEAVAREDSIRGAACLGINEVICGLEVKPMNAMHVRLLTLVGSPFMGRLTVANLAGTAEKNFQDGKPDILNDIMLFLWIVSPGYEAKSRASAIFPRKKLLERSQTFLERRRATLTARDKFNEAFAPILKQPVDKAVKEILEYVDEAFIDSDESEAGGKSYYAFEVSIAHEMHKHYGYRVDFWDSNCPSDKNPILVPLKIVFQLRKLRAQIDGGRDSIVTNKSDRLISDGLGKMINRN